MRKNRGFTLVELMIVVAIVGILIAVLVGIIGGGVGKGGSEAAIRAAEINNFSNVRIMNKHAVLPMMTHGCSEGDSYAYDIVATNLTGREVSIVVCCGDWTDTKGCTIRTH